MTDLALLEAQGIEATIRLAAAGDELAFSRLVAEHHAAMARVAYVIAGETEVARDAVQSAWTIAWRRLGTLRDPAQVRAWLVAIAANEARQAVRRRRRAQVTDISAVIERSGGAEPEDAIRIMDLAATLRGLSPDDRTLLALRYVAGLDSSEIAMQLGGSASGVRSRLSRLLERLRADLEPTEGTD